MSAEDSPRQFTEHSLLDHLLELRTRLMVCVLAWLACSALAYIGREELLRVLAEPLAGAFAQPGSKRMIFTGLPEAFMTLVKLSLFAGFMLAFPIIAWQLYRFLAPGLYKTERRAVLPFMLAAPVLFYAGSALAYFYIFPLAWEFFVAFEMPAAGVGGLPVELEAKLNEYLGLVISMILAFGLAFQLPLGLVLMMRAGLVQVATLAKGRRYAVVILLATAAILTPPDIVSQVGLFAALYGLYEAAIVAGTWLLRHRAGQGEPEASE